MLNTEVRAVHDMPGEVDEFRMQVLMREMEDMVVENKLKSEVGPMRNAWDKAVAKQGSTRARSMSL